MKDLKDRARTLLQQTAMANDNAKRRGGAVFNGPVSYAITINYPGLPFAIETADKKGEP